MTNPKGAVRIGGGRTGAAHGCICGQAIPEHLLAEVDGLIAGWMGKLEPDASSDGSGERARQVGAGFRQLLENTRTAGDMSVSPEFSRFPTQDDLLLLRDLALHVSGRVLRKATDTMLEKIYGQPVPSDRSGRGHGDVGTSVALGKCLEAIRWEAGRRATFVGAGAV